MSDDGGGDRNDIGDGGGGEGGEGRGRGGQRQDLQHEESSTISDEQSSTSKRRPKVSPLFEKLSWEDRTATFRPTVGIAPFHKRRQLSDEEREETQNKRISDIVRELRKSTGHYVSDVFDCESRAQADEVCKHLQRNGRSFPRGFLLISSHNEHVHVAHDCSFSNGTCRCKFIQKTENSTGIGRRKRSIRRRPISCQLSETDVRNILEYFSERSEGRQIENLQVARRVERQQAEDDVLACAGPSGCESGRRMAECQENDDIELRFDELGRAYHYGSYSRNRKEDKEAPKGKRRKTNGLQAKTEAILEKLKKNPVSPI